MAFKLLQVSTQSKKVGVMVEGENVLCSTNPCNSVGSLLISAVVRWVVAGMEMMISFVSNPSHIVISTFNTRMACFPNVV